MPPITVTACQIAAARPAVGGSLLGARAQPRACAGLRLHGSGSTERAMHGSRLLARPPLHLWLRRLRRRRSAAAPPPRAALYSLPADLYGSLQTGCGIAFMLALGFSALPILTGDARERNERRYLSPDADEGAENIRWSVMGVLSVLPFINPMAWVFAALDDEEASTLYWSFAFLYALPYLGNGFELDGFAIVSLLVCILHVQVERLAQTEPVEIELPSALRTLLSSIPRAVRSLGRYGSSLGGEVAERTRSAEEARRRRPDRKFLEERSREARAELEDFDRRRRERQAEQRRLAQQQEQREKERER